MAVGLKTGSFYYELGAGSFLHSFFSTICFHLENEVWGGEYKVLMKELYQGKLSLQNIPQAKSELLEVRNRLKEFSPDKVIWDIADLTKKPPWGDNISDEIKNLSNYFVTSDGKDLITVMLKAFDVAMEIGRDIEII